MTLPDMKKFLPIWAGLVVATVASAMGGLPPDPLIVDLARTPHVKMRSVPYDAVQWTTGFWAERYQQLANVTLDESWRLLADPKAGHVLDNFRLAAKKPGQGGYAGTAWQDEWLYKWIEGASCVWRNTRDPDLLARINEGIDLIAAAQQPDGYLSTMPIVKGTKRFTEPREHELYNMGHLLTAGVIHHRMTGDDRLFEVARRAADFICATVGVTVDPYFAHNPSAIMGLVEMYRETGDKKYLAAAELIVDRRGEAPKKQALFTMTQGIAGTDLIQDRVPVRDSSEIVGHNVFFTYLYTGAGDVYAETGDPSLESALDRLWDDMTEHKMFIHGGVSGRPIGISHFAPVIEAAGDDYELPNAGCYNETCGQIGCMMWGYRMLTEEADGSYADIMEREMFNGFLGAQSLDGKNWFYRNIIRRYDPDHTGPGQNDMLQRGKPGRKAICCPSNLLRTLAELSSYFYSVDDQGIWVHQFGGNKADLPLVRGGHLALEQVTEYPWKGDIELKIAAAPAIPVAVRLRIPGWSRGATLKVNGGQVSAAAEHGYAMVSRKWKPGDTIELSLPMPADLIASDPRVEETRNQVAVRRGPVVYCVESPDLPEGVKVPAVYVPSDVEFKPDEGLPGVDGKLAADLVTLVGTGLHRPDPMGGELYRPLGAVKFERFPLRLIPYYAWSNRGKSAMSVWMPVVLGN